MPRIQKPLPLKSDSKIALIAPAFHFDQELLNAGRQSLKTQYNLNSQPFPDTFDSELYFADSEKVRLQAIIDALVSPNIEALIGIRGGFGCARFYSNLVARLKKIQKNKKLKPKIVAGYSDLTILLNGFFQDFGWTTFHTPMVVGRSMREPLPIEKEFFLKTLFSAKPLGKISTNEMQTLSPGRAKGILVGGCLSLLVSSVGTPYEVKLKNRILFLEDVGEAPYRVDRMLTQMLHSGSLTQAKGIIFGQMTDCKPHSEAYRDVSVLQAIQSALKDLKCPIVYGFPAGHGSPQISFPLGIPVEIDASLGGTPSVTFCESGVK